MKDLAKIVIKHPMALHKHLGIEPGHPLPTSMLLGAQDAEDPKIRKMATDALKARKAKI